jgi:putative transcriptional regulator
MAGDTAPLLLVSMPQMADPNFARSVVLLCDYNEQGAFGLVVNRRLPEPAWQLIKTNPPIEVNPELRLWMGGPVDLQRAWVLMSEAQGPDDEHTLQLLQAPPTPRARVIVGYAGWGPGQLDKELAESAWLTTDVDAGLIFGVPADEMWETAIRRLGADPAALQTSSGVH